MPKNILIFSDGTGQAGGLSDRFADRLDVQCDARRRADRRLGLRLLAAENVIDLARRRSVAALKVDVDSGVLLCGVCHSWSGHCESLRAAIDFPEREH
jgi:hypothetical protein